MMMKNNYFSNCTKPMATNGNKSQRNSIIEFKDK